MEFEKAAQVSPDSPEVFAIWGTALRVQEKYKGANRHFAKAMELSPDDAEGAFNWGVSRFREKATDEAIKLFLKYRSPFNHLALVFKKSKVLKAGNYSEYFRSNST